MLRAGPWAWCSRGGEERGGGRFCMHLEGFIMVRGRGEERSGERQASGISKRGMGDVPLPFLGDGLFDGWGPACGTLSTGGGGAPSPSLPGCTAAVPPGGPEDRQQNLQVRIAPSPPPPPSAAASDRNRVGQCKAGRRPRTVLGKHSLEKGWTRRGTPVKPDLPCRPQTLPDPDLQSKLRGEGHRGPSKAGKAGQRGAAWKANLLPCPEKKASSFWLLAESSTPPLRRATAAAVPQLLLLWGKRACPTFQWGLTASDSAES